jgi:tryptophanyl-tRNA synthetase
MQVLTPIQDRRRKYEENPKLAWDILEAGSAKAREIAGATMEEVREAMHMSQVYEAPEKSAGA